ncbi:MAG: YihY/virulence factor BrkB family protein [Solirubrobacterales bacterium]|nr:YihY/virulence factor BrkB family protein [Solirubrobacterales bacterium]
MTTSKQVDPRRIRLTLTFWLRPAFVLRVLGRFQRVAGFDRAIALASSALAALLPLAIVGGAILPHIDAAKAGDRIIARYGLTGGGAQAVRDVLSPASGTSTDVSLFGVFLLVVATLSFSRGTQRLFEQTWELKPLSVRNTLNDLIWIVGFVVYVGVSGWIHGLVDHGRVEVAANLLLLPVSAAFLAWSGRVLSAGRIEWRGLLPFAVIGAALFALCFIGAGVYVPHLFSSYASRYGAVGAVLAMLSALFAIMLVLVGSAAIGREVFDELGRIGRGERPPDDEVRREWDALIDEARSRWETLRGRFDRSRRDDQGAGDRR